MRHKRARANNWDIHRHVWEQNRKKIENYLAVLSHLGDDPTTTEEMEREISSLHNDMLTAEIRALANDLQEMEALHAQLVRETGGRMPHLPEIGRRIYQEADRPTEVLFRQAVQAVRTAWNNVRRDEKAAGRQVMRGSAPPGYHWLEQIGRISPGGAPVHDSGWLVAKITARHLRRLETPQNSGR